MNPRDKARAGLGLLKEAVCDYLAEYPDGRTNADIVRALEQPKALPAQAAL